MSESSADESAKWRDHVGGFILACGDIELITFRIWADLFGAKKPEHNLKPRIRTLITELCDRTPRRDSIINILYRALNLADKRNIVAHNPLQLQVYEHRRTRELQFEYAISGVRPKDYIDDLELIELRAEAEDIVSELYIKYPLVLYSPARS